MFLIILIIAMVLFYTQCLRINIWLMTLTSSDSLQIPPFSQTLLLCILLGNKLSGWLPLIAFLCLTYPDTYVQRWLNTQCSTSVARLILDCNGSFLHSVFIWVLTLISPDDSQISLFPQTLCLCIFLSNKLTWWKTNSK